MVPLTDSESSWYWDQDKNVEDTSRKNSDHGKERGQATGQSCGIEQPFVACLRATVKTEGHASPRGISDKGLVHSGISVQHGIREQEPSANRYKNTRNHVLAWTG